MREGLAREGFHFAADFYYSTELRKVRFEHKTKTQPGKRRPKKTFRWEYLSDGQWWSGDGGKPKPLYVNQILRESDQLGTVLGVEGEAKAILAGKLGLPAFSFHDDVSPKQAANLVDCDVILWADNDSAGTKLALARAEVLAQHGLARSISIVELSGELPESGDIVDAVHNLGWDRQRIENLLHGAQPYSAESTTSVPTDLTAEPVGTQPCPFEIQVEKFPVDVLPEPLARFVSEASEALPCPPDFVAVPMLALLGSAIGTSTVIEIKPGWHEGSRLYTALVADPGTKKSPALELAMKPLRDRQAELASEYQKAKEEYGRALAEHEAAMPQYNKKKGKGATERPKKPEKPAMAQVFTTDATLEVLAVLLHQNPRGLVFVCDELTGWARAMNQYRSGRGADRQAWLSFWSGAPVIVNRKALKEPLVLPDPFISVAGCLPPGVLDELADERGREDGFLHRILFSFPDPIQIRWTDRSVGAKTVASYCQVFEGLFALQSTQDDQGRSRPTVLELTPEGKSLFVECVNRHHAEMAKPNFPEHLRGPWSKLEGYCARFALILQSCRHAAREARLDGIDAVSVSGAVTLTDYFKSPTRKVYARLRATEDDRKVAKLVAWIRREGGSATVRDVVSFKVAGCKKASEAKALFLEMEERGYGSIEEVTPPQGGRKSVLFKLRLQPAIGS